MPTIQYIGTFDDPNYWMGYTFIMSNGSKNVFCKIENDHKCCERWGVHTTSNLDDFIGAEYYSVNISDETTADGTRETMRMMDITISTNRGNILIHFYNEHNGYYSHDVFIQTEHGIKTISL